MHVLSRRQRAALPALMIVLVLAVPGCPSAPTAGDADDVKIDLAFQPDPPRVGPEQATVRLSAADGSPVAGAAVKLEGNMNHAGMEPVFADAKETEPGLYQAELELTMGGDWFVLVSARLADGRALQRKVDVRGVRSR
jgi:hypothetical protein